MQGLQQAAPQGRVGVLGQPVHRQIRTRLIETPHQQIGDAAHRIEDRIGHDFRVDFADPAQLPQRFGVELVG